MKINENDMKKELSKIQQYYMPDFPGQAFAWGNAKIPMSTLIVNITSALHCPCKRLGTCRVINCCYASKCERIYPYYLRKNLFIEEWLYQTRTHDIIALMSAYIRYAPVKITCIRLNEAGDFINQNQIVQWNKIAKYFWETYGITTYTYTARTDLDFTVAPYIILNGSVPRIAGAIRNYICVSKEVYNSTPTGNGVYKCPGDCKICHLCSSTKFRGGTIIVPKH